MLVPGPWHKLRRMLLPGPSPVLLSWAALELEPQRAPWPGLGPVSKLGRRPALVPVPEHRFVAAQLVAVLRRQVPLAQEVGQLWVHSLVWAMLLLVLRLAAAAAAVPLLAQLPERTSLPVQWPWHTPARMLLPELLPLLLH